MEERAPGLGLVSGLKFGNLSLRSRDSCWNDMKLKTNWMNTPLIGLSMVFETNSKVNKLCFCSKMSLNSFVITETAFILLQQEFLEWRVLFSSQPSKIGAHWSKISQQTHDSLFLKFWTSTFVFIKNNHRLRSFNWNLFFPALVWLNMNLMNLFAFTLHSLHHQQYRYAPCPLSFPSPHLSLRLPLSSLALPWRDSNNSSLKSGPGNPQGPCVGLEGHGMNWPRSFPCMLLGL